MNFAMIDEMIRNILRNELHADIHIQIDILFWNINTKSQYN